jgi:lipopolysaccharide transport system ATP-binding protein
VTQPIIEIEGLGKKYRIGAQREPYLSLRDSLARQARELLSRLAGQQAPGGPHHSTEDFWALKDVSFSVREGEAVGIIGRNGAGKSTLLKILSQITPPTEGRITCRGRIASLLEVGTGFHPELTGRENIFLNGTILGMSRSEVKRKFDEIVAFSEMETFLDTPVKRYSSGMYVRLAFAVAAHLEPEILVVDEVLAVGDAAFQKKCLGKIGEATRGGRTVLFVSHNMVAVEGLCQKAILLDRGRLVMLGSVSQVIGAYLRTSEACSSERVWHDQKTAPGNDTVRLRRARVCPVACSSQDAMTVDTPILLDFEYWNQEPNACLTLSLYLVNETGIRVFNTFPVDGSNLHGRPLSVGLYRSTCTIPRDLLNDGQYSVHFHVIRDRRRVVYDYEGILTFEVADSATQRGGWSGKWTGVVRPKLAWTTEQIETGQ